jgi:hypothetical protein
MRGRKKAGAWLAPQPVVFNSGKSGARRVSRAFAVRTIHPLYQNKTIEIGAQI